jgi:hypothetical protein
MEKNMRDGRHGNGGFEIPGVYFPTESGRSGPRGRNRPHLARQGG